MFTCSMFHGRLGTLCDHGQWGRASEHGGQRGTDGHGMFVFNQQHYQNVSTYCNYGCIQLRSPMGHLRLHIYGHPSSTTWGLDEIEIKGLEKGGVYKWVFKLGEHWLCFVWCLGSGWCLTNVAWYTGYQKLGQGFHPGHEFLDRSFCLIGQLDQFLHIF